MSEATIQHYATLSGYWDDIASTLFGPAYGLADYTTGGWDTGAASNDVPPVPIPNVTGALPVIDGYQIGREYGRGLMVGQTQAGRAVFVTQDDRFIYADGSTVPTSQTIYNERGGVIWQGVRESWDAGGARAGTNNRNPNPDPKPNADFSKYVPYILVGFVGLAGLAVVSGGRKR